MLDFMRRNANSWVMIFLFAIIIFVFAINFGPWAGNVSPSVPYAAQVNNEAISMAEFRTAFASQFARIKQFRPDYGQEQAEQDGLKRMVLEQLVSRELLTQLGRENNLRIGAKTLADEIKERVFGPDVDFDKEEYVRRINAFFQSSVGQFEEQVEKELVAEQMANLLGTAVFVSESEARENYIDKNTEITVEYIKVSPEFFTNVGQPKQNEIDAFEKEHAQKISEHYNANIGNYVKDEEVKASHILVKTNQSDSEQEKADKKARAQTLLSRLKNGEDFAKLASAESDDTGTKSKGGDLGFFSAGKMVEEFSTAAFALNKGELSDVVESPFGFHIIKVVDKKPEEKRTLGEASKEIAQLLLKKEQQNELAKRQAELALNQLKSGRALKDVRIANLINKKASTTEGNEKEFAPVANETPTFNKASSYISGIGRAEPIIDKLFTLTMAKPTKDQPIFANGAYFAIRLSSKKDADLAKFDSEKEGIINSLVFPRKRAFMQQYLSHLKSTAKITYNDALLSGGTVDL